MNRRKRPANRCWPARPCPRAISPKEFQEELERIELELTVMLIEEPTDLVVRFALGADQYAAGPIADGGRARPCPTIGQQDRRFEDIKQRQEEVLAMRDHTERDSRLYARLRPRDDADDERSAARLEIDGRFDGVGQLTQVPAPKTALRVTPWSTARATCVATSRRRRACVCTTTSAARSA